MYVAKNKGVYVHTAVRGACTTPTLRTGAPPARGRRRAVRAPSRQRAHATLVHMLPESRIRNRTLSPGGFKRFQIPTLHVERAVPRAKRPLHLPAEAAALLLLHACVLRVDPLGKIRRRRPRAILRAIHRRRRDGRLDASRGVALRRCEWPLERRVKDCLGRRWTSDGGWATDERPWVSDSDSE